MSLSFAQHYARTASQLSDEALLNELRCARQSAMRCTRARRDLMLLRVRCLDCELARRAAMTKSADTTVPGGSDLARQFLSKN